MFGPFLYFIVVLVIVSLYPTDRPPPNSLSECVLGTVALFVVFAIVTRLGFRSVRRRSRRLSPWEIDVKRSRIRHRLSLLAIGVVAADVYGFGMTRHLARWTVIQWVPTLATAAMLVVFTACLCMVWAAEYQFVDHGESVDGSDRAIYIQRQARLVLPAALPWFALSLAMDLLYRIPIPAVQSTLNTTTGQVIVLVVLLAAAAVFGPAFIRRFWQCRPLAAGPVRRRIEALCERAGVRVADIYLWPLFGQTMITAGVMGIVGRFRYLLITNGLLQFLTEDEIDSVVAHEIGHVTYRHLPAYLLAIIGLTAISVIWVDAIVLWVSTGSGFRHVTAFLQVSAESGYLIVYGVVLIGMLVVFFRYVFGYFMRHFEREADLHVYSLLPSAFPLMRTMDKIATITGMSPTRPNWHHFSIAQRIGFLRQCESDPAMAAQYHRRLRRRVIALFAAMAVAISGGILLKNGSVGYRFGVMLIERQLTATDLAARDRAVLYRQLGDEHYGRRQWSAAIDAWTTGLSLAPDDPTLLNNLAWVYATADDHNLRHPQQALIMAERAAALAPEAFILDTLAEARFAVGDRKGAVAAAGKALSAAAVPGASPTASADPDYYRKQLDRFRSAPLPDSPAIPSQ